MAYYDPQTGFASDTPPAWMANLPRFAPVAPEQPNLFTSALSSGFHEALGNVGGAAQAAGTALGMPSVAGWGQNLAQSQAQEAETTGRPDLEANPWSLKGIAYNLTKSLPTLGGAIGAGTLATLAAPEALAGAAGAAGAGLFMYPQAVGGNAQVAQQTHANQLTPGDAAKSLLLGVPEAAAMSYMPGALRNIVESGVEGSLGRRALVGGGKLGIYQGLLSGGQTAVTQQAFTPDMPTADKARQIVDAALSGGLQGAVFGGVVGALSRKVAPVTEKPATDVQNNDLTGAIDASLNRTSTIPSPENMTPLPRNAGDYSDTANPDLLAMALPLADKGADRTAAENVQHVLLQQEIARRTQPGLATGEGTLFTPEEMADRQPKIKALSEGLATQLAAPGKASDAAIADIQGLNAANDPEMINALRARVAAGDKSAAVNQLAQIYGITGPTPAEQIVDLRQQENLSMEARVAAQNAGNVPAMRAANGAIIDAGIKIRNATKLLDLHTAADDLMPKPEVPLPAPIADAMGQLNLPSLGEKAAQEPSIPEVPAPREPNKDQLALLTPEETGAQQQMRQVAVQNFQNSLIEHIPARSRRAVAPVLASLDVANEPELINALKAHIADADANSGGSLSSGVRALASEYGITDQTGGPRDLLAERTALNDQYNSLLDRASKAPEGQKAALFEQAMSTRNGPLKQMDSLLDLHAQADDLDKTLPTTGVPDRVPPEMASQWSTLDAIKSSDDPVLSKAADNAQKAIEQRIPEARQIAQLTINRFANSQRTKVVTEKTDAVREPSATGVDVQQAAENGGAVGKGHAEGNVVTEEVTPTAVSKAEPQKSQTYAEVAAQLGSNLTPSPKKIKLPPRMPPDREKLQALHDAAEPNSARQDFLAKALDTAASAPSASERDNVISNALTTIAKSEMTKGNKLFRNDLPPVSAPVDNALAHIIGVGGTGKDVTAFLSEGAADPAVRAYARTLSKLGVDPTISFEERDAQVPEGAVGAYSRSNDHIELYEPRGLEKTLLHELTHAGTSKALISQTTPAAKEMQRLYDAVSKSEYETHPGQDEANFYGLTNVHEFVAEAFSNSRFAEFLRSLPTDTGSRVANMWQAVKNAVFKMLGMPERMRSMFDQVMDVGHEVLNENTRIGSVEDTTNQMRSAAQEAVAMKDQFFARKSVDEVIRDSGVGSLSRAEKLAKVWNYFATMQAMVNDFGKYFKSGGLQSLRLAKRFHSTLGDQYSGVAYIARKAADAFKAAAPGEHAEMNEAMRLGTQLRFDPLRTWAQQPDLAARPDAAKLEPLVDRANGIMSRVRQKGGMDAYNKMLAYNQMGHFTRLAHMMSEARRLVFAEHNIAGYAGDQFEDFAKNDAAHISPEIARDFSAEVLRQERTGFDQTIQKLTGDMTSLPMTDVIGRKAIAAKIKPLQDMADSVGREVKAMQDSPYFHMGRNGEYFAAMTLAHDPNDETQINTRSAMKLQDALVKDHFGDVIINQGINNRKVYIRTDTPEQMQAIHAIAQRLAAEGHVETDSISLGSLTDVSKRQGLVSETLEKLISSVAHSSNFDAATKEKVQKELELNYLDMMPDQRLVWQARENVQGPSGDMVRSFVKRAQIEANALANLGAAGKTNDAMGSINADAADAKRGDNPRQTLMMQSVQNELQRREANRIWRPTHTILDTTRAFVHAWYLGISPAYFALELSQMGIGAIPEMAKTHGFARATASVVKNLPMTFRVMRWIASGQLAKYATPTIENAAKFGVPESVARFVLGMSNQGILETGSMTHALGMSATEGVRRGVDTALHWANISALYTEVAMRVNVGLASRDLHNFRPFLDRNGMPDLDAFVDKNVNEGLQDFSISNSPRALGKQGFAGQLTPTISQFSGWQLRMIQKLYTEVHGLISKDSTPELRAQSGKFLLGHLGAVGVLSGVLGLPMLQTALGASSNIANALSGSEQFDFEDQFRGFLSNMFGPEFGDAVARGVPHLGGIDLSEFGDQALVPFSQFLSDQRSFQDAASDMAWHSLGSSTSFVANIIKGFSEFSHGDGIHGMETLMPASLKGPYEAYLMNKFGYEDKTGAKWFVQPSGADIAKKAFGLEPANYRQFEDERDAMENMQARRELVTSYLRGNLERAFSHGDVQGEQNAMGAIVSYMQRNPGIIMNPASLLQNQLRRQTLSRAMQTPAGVSPTDFGMRRLLAPFYAGQQQ